MTAALRCRAALSGALVLTLLLAAPSCDEQTPPAAPVVPAPTPPPAPEPLAVPTGLRAVPVRMSGTVRWEWDPVAGAGWYQVQLSTDEVFADEDTITTAEVRDRPYYARAALADATTYYLRVRALAGSRADPMTSAWSGGVAATTLDPNILPPPSGLRIIYRGKDFVEWEWDYVTSASGYDVQFSQTGAFSAADEVIPRSARDNFYQRQGLLSGTTYHLRVRSAAEREGLRITSAWTAGLAGMTEGPADSGPRPDQRQSPLCESVSITSIAPIREVPIGSFCPTYEIAFSVTTDLSDAMALDFLRPYKVTDWDVTLSGDEIRHDLKVLWEPRHKRFQERSEVPEVLPMTILACPEGERGPVLACSDTSCDTYASEASVPSYWHEPAMGILHSPWPYSELRTVREGESLEIEAGYEFRRPLDTDFDVEVEVGPPYGSSLPRELFRDLDFDPPIHVLREGTTGSGVLRFTLTVRPNDRQQDDFVFVLRFRARKNPRGCFIPVGAFRLRVTD